MTALFGPRRLEEPEGIRVIASIGRQRAEGDSPSVTWWAPETKPGAKRIPSKELKNIDPYIMEKLPSPGVEFEEALRVVFFAATPRQNPNERSDQGEIARAILEANDIRIQTAKDFCFGRLDVAQETIEES